LSSTGNSQQPAGACVTLGLEIRLVIRSGRDEPSIRENDAAASGIASQDDSIGDLISGVDAEIRVPDPSRSVTRRGDEEMAIRREVRCPKRVLMPTEHKQGLAGLGIP
jgi:hypothetical protein